MSTFESTPSEPAASLNACDAAFWQQRVALALGTSKIGASHAGASGVAKQLARLAATAAMADPVHTPHAQDVASEFTQALQACSDT